MFAFFDGLQNVLERCVLWYEEKLSVGAVGALVREDAMATTEPSVPVNEIQLPDIPVGLPLGIPEGIEIIEAEAITDRKSVFVGRACRISEPSQVPLILSYLMADRRISRAAHPIINAWRCNVGTSFTKTMTMMERQQPVAV